MQDTGSLGLVHWDDPEGWYGEGGSGWGTHVHPWQHKGGVICISKVIDISPGNLDSSLCFFSPVFLMMYSAYKLNKQGDNIQP